jgi:hypothetical protein
VLERLADDAELVAGRYRIAQVAGDLQWRAIRDEVARRAARVRAAFRAAAG